MPPPARNWSCLIDLSGVLEELLREGGDELLAADSFVFLAMEFTAGLHLVIGSRRHMMYSCPEGKHGPILEELRAQTPHLYPYLMKHAKVALVTVRK